MIIYVQKFIYGRTDGQPEIMFLTHLFKHLIYDNLESE